MDDSEVMFDKRNGTRELAIWDHPIDHFEPLLSVHDELRDCRLKTIQLLNNFALEMQRALTGNPNPATAVRDGLVKLAGISFAMGLNVCGESSMTQRAAELGVTRATISKIATSWCVSHDLCPSFAMKSSEAVVEYARARRAVVQSSSQSNGNGEALPVPPKGRSV